jgi:hypothetical protein
MIQTPLKKGTAEDFTADQPNAKITWNNARELQCFAYENASQTS